jgi:hypothetical protein
MMNYPQENYFQTLNDEYNLYNSLPLNTLENKIEDFNMVLPNQMENTANIDNQINSFINNFFDTNSNEQRDQILRKTCLGCEFFEQIPPEKEDNSALVTLIKQIDDLEKILQETKMELLKNSFSKKL